MEVEHFVVVGLVERVGGDLFGAGGEGGGFGGGGVQGFFHRVGEIKILL